MRLKSTSWWRCICGGVLVVGLGAAWGRSEEPARAFLSALRERRYFDTAMEYLDSIENSPLVPAAVRATLPLERGKILADLGAIERDRGRQDELLAQAESAFKSFIQQQPNHPMVSEARRKLGSLLVVRARTLKLLADKEGNTKHLQEALKLFDAAEQVYQNSLDEMKPQLASLKSVPAGETQLLELQRTLRDEFFQTMLVQANVLVEKGDLLEEGSAEAKKAYAASAKAFEAIYEKYRTKLGALYARVYQAGSLRKIGQSDKAIAILVSDILDQSVSHESFRMIRTKALILAIEIWLDSEQAKFAEAVRRGTDWIAQQRPNERGTHEWLKLKLTTARAMKAYAEKLGYQGKDEAQAKEMLKTARELAREVLRFPSPLKSEARAFLTQLPGGLDVAEQDKLPETFEDAEAQAKEVLALLDESRRQVEQTRQSAATAVGDERTRLEAELQEHEKALAQQIARAEKLSRHALVLGGEELDIGKRTTLLYFLSFIAIVDSRPYDAYVYSSYVANRYPDATNARACIKTAIQAAATVYERAPKDDRQFETELLRRTAQYAVDTWPSEPEGEFAMGVLVPFEIQAGHLERAEGLAAKIPPDSPMWYEARLRIGSALWRQARDAKPDGGSESGNGSAASPMRIEAVRKKAIGYLEEGTRGIKKLEQVTALGAQGTASLVQAYLDDGQTDAALERLEDPDRGLLAFVGSGKQAEGLSPQFPFAVYRLALQAFVQRIGAGAGSGKQDEILARLKEVMEQLDQFAGEGVDGKRKKLGVYYSLTTELSSQIKTRANPSERASLAQGAQVLLSAVAEQADDVTFLRWAGDTLSSLAGSLESSSTTLAQSRELYRRAAKAYQRVLAMIKQATQPTNPALVSAVQYKLAIALQRSGDLPQAVEIFRDLLQAKNMMLTAQIEAAKTYELWADRDKRRELYEKALVGAFPSGKKRSNAIWGWIKLGRLTMRYPKFRETFFEAQYHTARCQLRLAETEQDSAKRKRMARSAKITVVQTQKAFPDLGGAAWRPKFDALLKQVQKRLGESPVGLKAISKKKTRRS